MSRQSCRFQKSVSYQYVHSQPVGPVVALQQRLVDAFPAFDDLSTRSEHGFQPHLSVGQWRAEREMLQKREEFQRTWSKLAYDVDCVYLISRVEEEPFQVRYIVKFDGQIIPIAPVEQKCVAASFFSSIVV